MKNTRKIAGKYLGWVLAAAVLLFIIFAEQNGNQTTEGAKLGQQAPDFEAEHLDGSIFTLSSLKGKPIILSFWATWCIPCRREMPILQELSDEGKIIVIGVNLQEKGPAIEKYIKSLNITFPIVLDTDGEIAKRYNVILKPATYFIDRNGIIVDKKYGELTADDLEQRSKKIK